MFLLVVSVPPRSFLSGSLQYLCFAGWQVGLAKWIVTRVCKSRHVCTQQTLLIAYSKQILGSWPSLGMGSAKGKMVTCWCKRWGWHKVVLKTGKDSWKGFCTEGIYSFDCQHMSITVRFQLCFWIPCCDYKDGICLTKWATFELTAKTFSCSMEGKKAFPSPNNWQILRSLFSDPNLASVIHSPDLSAVLQCCS